MSEKKLASYVKIYSMMRKNFCKKIVSELDHAEFQHHKWGNGKNSIQLNSEDELDISWSNIPSRDEVMRHIWDAVNRYVNEIDGVLFKGWDGFTGVRFNKYSKGKRMLPHIDHIKSMFDGERKGIPILSVVGLLNEDYTGGEFVMWEDTEMELKQGDIMIFPSNFMYPHHVNEVTDGTRNTFVSWAW